MSEQLQQAEIDAMKYYTTGHLTVGTITTVESHSLVNYYAPRVRGRYIGISTDDWKFKTREEALTRGREILAGWKAKLEGK